MSQSLTEALTIMEDAVAEIKAFVSEVTQDESLLRPSPEAWSIGEIVHHLVLVIRRAGNLPKILMTDAPDRFDYESVLAKRGFELPDVADPQKSGKGVAPEGMRPNHGADIKKLAEELEQAWQESKASITSVAGRDLHRYYYEHYRLGPLNLYEAIAFQGYHARKHLAQMQRTLKTVRAQAADIIKSVP